MGEKTDARLNVLSVQFADESHLFRQMTQVLHELQYLQAVRIGDDVALPAVLHVTIHSDKSVSSQVLQNEANESAPCA